MQDVLAQLTNFAERCEAMVVVIWPSLARAVAERSVNVLRSIATESRTLFTDAKTETIPTVDAIVARHKDRRLDQLREELVGLRDVCPTPGDEQDKLLSVIAPEYVQAKVDADKLAKFAKHDGIKNEFIVTWLRRGNLARFAKNLRYFVQYLRADHSLRSAFDRTEPLAIYNLSVNNSTIGGIGAGDGVRVRGVVSMEAASQLAQDQHHHWESIKEAQKALIDDEDRLDPILYEALELFLRAAREVKVEGRPFAKVQAELMRALEEVWEAKGLGSQALPPGLKVVEMLAKNAVTAEVATKLGA